MTYVVRVIVSPGRVEEQVLLTFFMVNLGHGPEDFDDAWVSALDTCCDVLEVKKGQEMEVAPWSLMWTDFVFMCSFLATAGILNASGWVSGEEGGCSMMTQEAEGGEGRMGKSWTTQGCLYGAPRTANNKLRTPTLSEASLPLFGVSALGGESERVWFADKPLRKHSSSLTSISHFPHPLLLNTLLQLLLQLSGPLEEGREGKAGLGGGGRGRGCFVTCEKEGTNRVPRHRALRLISLCTLRCTANVHS